MDVWSDFDAKDDHAGLMDGIYRYQKHIYDVTRKYYLLGRDRMIGNLDLHAEGTVLEVGCGTGRNLIVAGKSWPQARLFGFDISTEMLSTAGRNIAIRLPGKAICLAQADACNFSPVAQFGISGFDRIFISYSLSMIPDWKLAAERALMAVNPGGALHIVDFGDQAGLPFWFRGLLRRWLAVFHVSPRLDMPELLNELASKRGAELTFKPLYRGYAWSAVLKVPDDR